MIRRLITLHGSPIVSSHSSYPSCSPLPSFLLLAFFCSLQPLSPSSTPGRVISRSQKRVFWAATIHFPVLRRITLGRLSSRKLATLYPGLLPSLSARQLGKVLVKMAMATPLVAENLRPKASINPHLPLTALFQTQWVLSLAPPKQKISLLGTTRPKIQQKIQSTTQCGTRHAQLCKPSTPSQIVGNGGQSMFSCPGRAAPPLVVDHQLSPVHCLQLRRSRHSPHASELLCLWCFLSWSRLPSKLLFSFGSSHSSSASSSLASQSSQSGHIYSPTKCPDGANTLN